MCVTLKSHTGGERGVGGGYEETGGTDTAEGNELERRGAACVPADSRLCWM